MRKLRENWKEIVEGWYISGCMFLGLTIGSSAMYLALSEKYGFNDSWAKGLPIVSLIFTIAFMLPMIIAIGIREYKKSFKNKQPKVS